MVKAVMEEIVEMDVMEVVNVVVVVAVMAKIVKSATNVDLLVILKETAQSLIKVAVEAETS